MGKYSGAGCMTHRWLKTTMSGGVANIATIIIIVIIIIATIIIAIIMVTIMMITIPFLTRRFGFMFGGGRSGMYGLQALQQVEDPMHAFHSR